MSGSRRRLRTVVDTNLFVSAALFKRGNPYALRRAWHDGLFELLLSDAHHAELIDVFGRPRLIQRYRVAPDDLAEFFADLAEATLVEPASTIPVTVRDPKDVKILATALGGEADYLVTGDADLLEHRGDPRLGSLRIVTVTEFLAVLEQRATKQNDR
jgi:putative PIN family toxin of toxin-antitoxin system